VIGTPNLLLVSVAFLSLAIGAAWLVARLQPERARPAVEEDPEAPPAVDERR
jgi:ATP:ADP antiporter, AAA family